MSWLGLRSIARADGFECGGWEQVGHTDALSLWRPTRACDARTITAPPSGGSAVTLDSWSNIDKRSYALESFNLAAFAGQTVALKFTGSEDYSLQTSFVIDDVSLSLGG